MPYPVVRREHYTNTSRCPPRHKLKELICNHSECFPSISAEVIYKYCVEITRATCVGGRDVFLHSVEFVDWDFVKFCRPVALCPNFYFNLLFIFISFLSPLCGRRPGRDHQHDQLHLLPLLTCHWCTWLPSGSSTPVLKPALMAWPLLVHHLLWERRPFYCSLGSVCSACSCFWTDTLSRTLKCFQFILFYLFKLNFFLPGDPCWD